MRHGVSKEAASERSLNGEHFCALLHMLQKREDAGSLLHLWDLSIWAFIHTDVLILKTSDWRFSVLGRKNLFYVCCNKQVQDLFESEKFIYWNVGVFWLISVSHISIWWQMTTLQMNSFQSQPMQKTSTLFPPTTFTVRMHLLAIFMHAHVMNVCACSYFHKIHRQTLVLCCVPVTKCRTASACLSVCEALYKCWCFWCCSGLVLRWMFEVRHGTTCMTDRHVIPDKLSHGAAHLSHSSGR